MRLIDADKADVESISCFYGSECRIADVQEWLDEQPTVDAHGWISVDDRIPTWQDGAVLVFTKYGFSICERTTSNRWQGKHANWITHWMPLPEPPKKKEN